MCQLLHDRIANLHGGGVAAEILGSETTIQGCADSVLDGLGLLGEVEGVSEQHGDGEDGADGVDDALAGDIRGGAFTASVLSRRRIIGWNLP